MRIATASLIAVVGASIAFAGACSSSPHNTSPTSPSDGGNASETGVPDGSASSPTPDAGPPAPLEGSAPALVPASQQHDASSSAVVFDRLRGGVWTANGDVGSVSYANVDTFALGTEIAAGQDIRSVAVSPDGVWVAAVDRAGAAVVLIDAEARVVKRTIALGTHPRAAVWDAANPRWLYVAVEDDDAVAVIDRTAGVLATTVAVGRLPSGVAVSSQRRELYVTHRIDGKVTVVPLDSAALAPVPVATAPASGDDGGGEGGSEAGAPAPTVDASLPSVDAAGAPFTVGEAPQTQDVTLALEVGDGTAKTPHGAPFAFESLAWAPDGNVAWLPHELLASTHPFQFQSILFPAVSVVDLSARQEVQTNPSDPTGNIAGRKNLFAAMLIIDATGNNTVLSQPCAAAFHPNGTTAYVLACASEDLLTFDTTQGIAIDILRNLPGDHPVGLTLDDTGQRAFILSDQSEDPSLASKSLTVLDLAGGSVLGHAKVIGKPIGLVAKDTVDPTLRAGLRFFFRANSSKGTLATAGNNWMACGSCHLDGFTSTNEAFFEDMSPIDPTQDGRIGHSGLKDFFSKTPPANDKNDPAFDPHDILAAFEEQGGLAPDRTGAQRTGAVDPSAPTADATTMAADIAKVVGRDLPLGPSWLLGGGQQPNTTYDGQWCGNCHQDEFAAWQKSAHAHAALDPMVRFGASVEVTDQGAQYPRLCAGCHDPVTARTGDTTLQSGRGITCLGCHESERLIRAGGNADIEAHVYDWTQTHKDRALAGLATLRKPEFCGGCHQQFVPATGLLAITTLGEWHASPFSGTTPDGGAAPTTLCVDCHVPKGASGKADHTMIGGNVYMASQIVNDPATAAAEQANLQKGLRLAATRKATAVFVTVQNTGIGHSFPTGVSDIREPWVELQAVDAKHNVVARYGGPAADGTIPATAARLGMDIAQDDGTVLYLHQLSKTTRIPFARFVPAGGSTELVLTGPDTLPAGAVELDAVLLYRNVRTPYFRAATGDAGAASPEVEVARVAIP